MCICTEQVKLRACCKRELPQLLGISFRPANPIVVC